jgi:Flp pilus assembly protein TadG
VCAKESGAHTVEFAIVALPLLIVTFMVIQAALVFHARSMALAAATQGAQVARAYGSSPAAGKNKAEDFLEVIGQGLREPEVRVASSPTDVTVTVTGQAPSIVPFITFDISQTASGPIERFVS